jgi:hypothetical protein
MTSRVKSGMSHRHVIGWVVWLLSWSTAVAASVQIAAIDPPPGSTLHAREPLYVRMQYRSDVPLRFQARGFYEGTEILNGAAMNPAPPYGPGDGEAIAWVSYDRTVQIDDVRINVFGADWKPIETVSMPVDITWDGVPPPSRRQPAEWATRLNAAQQSMTHSNIGAATQTDGDWGGLLIMLAGWSVIGYIVLQIYMALRYKDGWRKAALLPLWGTIPLLGYTLFALFMGSNLWPLMLIFLAPFAFVYLVGIWVVKRIRNRPD